MQEANFLLFSGSSHPELAEEVAGQLGIPLGRVQLGRFPDGEITLQILESVRGRDVFVLQTVALEPNEYLMELLILIDALKRASARSVAVVMPYYGYCRQDRKEQPRVPITAKLVANLLVNAGATRLVTMDLHAGQLQGFFDIPVDHLYARPLLMEAFRRVEKGSCVVVTPDMGGVKLARAYAKGLGVDFAIVDKHRKSDSDVEVMAIIGDVKGKDVLLADDMCSTAGTLVSAAKACREKGAKRIFAAVTHAILVGVAAARIEESPIEALWVSNTIPQSGRLSGTTKLRYVSVAYLFSQAIRCIQSSESISSLFE
jgi:ribose-phosphate pyrophosphokinase